MFLGPGYRKQDKGAGQIREIQGSSLVGGIENINRNIYTELHLSVVNAYNIKFPMFPTPKHAAQHP